MKRYDIRTVMDFVAVPPDRMDACLADFKGCIEFFRGVMAIAGNEGYADKVAAMGWQWIDDGQVGLVGFMVEDAQTGETESEGA